MKIGIVDDFGEFLGIMEMSAAVDLAKKCNKDLILINPKTNTYKIADAGKLKYEQKQKEKQSKIQKKTNKIKEIKLRPVIDKHDLEVKINHIREFLSKGLRTKIIMTFKGRQIVHKDIALEKFNEIPTTLIKEGLAVLESPPKFEGKDLVAFLVPVQK